MFHPIFEQTEIKNIDAQLAVTVLREEEKLWAPRYANYPCSCQSFLMPLNSLELRKWDEEGNCGDIPSHWPGTSVSSMEVFQDLNSECSVAWMLVNEFIGSHYVISFVMHCGHGERNFESLFECRTAGLIPMNLNREGFVRNLQYRLRTWETSHRLTEDRGKEQ
jgi:hypothetical protein